jgi:hypothetical protein
MKNAVIAICLAFSFAGCASDADTPEPAEIGTDAPGSSIDDGRLMWVEVIESEGVRITQLHHFDSQTGIDSIDILDDDGVIQRSIETRYHATSIPVEDPR